MKKKLTLGLSILAVSVCQTSLSASYQHFKPFYLGAEIGGGNLHYKNSDLSDGAISVNDTGFASHLLGGFDVNPNLGLELGYTLYENTELKYFPGVKTDFSQQSLDFLAKLSVPLSCNLGLFAKAGMSYIHRDDVKFVNDNLTIQVNDSDNYLRPMLGAGISYGFTPQISGTVSYYRTFGANNLEDADFYGVGITFRVG